MTDNNPIAKQSSAVEKMAQEWPVISALMGGTRTMRETGQQFLPKWPKEDDESYKARLLSAVLHNVFKRTVKILAYKFLLKQKNN